MILARWFVKMLADIVLVGVVNRSFAISFVLLALFTVGLTIGAAQVSAPFIYTLF